MRKILIVEDNEADQFLNELIIKQANSEVEIMKASDGKEALEVLEKHFDEIDVILLDINMPRMNGHDFLEAYSIKHNSDIPVVVMLTSSDQKEDREKAQSYKCVKDYLLKPISVEVIQNLEKIVKQ